MMRFLRDTNPPQPDWWQTLREIMRLEIKPIVDRMDKLERTMDSTYSKEMVDAKLADVRDDINRLRQDFDCHANEQEAEPQEKLNAWNMRMAIWGVIFMAGMAGVDVLMRILGIG